MYAVTNIWPSEAAQEMVKNRDVFVQNVKTAMRGGSVKGEQYNNVVSR